MIEDSSERIATVVDICEADEAFEDLKINTIVHKPIIAGRRNFEEEKVADENFAERRFYKKRQT